MTPTLNHLAVTGPNAKDGGQRRIAWWEWNATGQPYPAHLVVCLHGLTRQSRDFDLLAQALAPHACVVCVDMAGRGNSDWLAEPMYYQIPTYSADVALLLEHLRQRHAVAQPGATPVALSIDLVGTSMGGLIGMALAAQPKYGLRRLVLNDVGPIIQPASLQRIAACLGQKEVFPSEQAAADYLWEFSCSFGPHTSEQWLALSRPMLRPAPGGWRLHYDPDIALPFKALLAAETAAGSRQAAHASEQVLWQLYDAIEAPTLLLRGAESDLLSHETALAMTLRGPRPQLIEFPGVGHAPTLVCAEQVDIVKSFLLH